MNVTAPSQEDGRLLKKFVFASMSPSPSNAFEHFDKMSELSSKMGLNHRWDEFMTRSEFVQQICEIVDAMHERLG